MVFVFFIYLFISLFIFRSKDIFTVKKVDERVYFINCIPAEVSREFHVKMIVNYPLTIQYLRPTSENSINVDSMLPRKVTFSFPHEEKISIFKKLQCINNLSQFWLDCNLFIILL